MEEILKLLVIALLAELRSRGMTEEELKREVEGALKSMKDPKNLPKP